MKNPFNALLVPKARRVVFETTVMVHELANVPHLSGMYYAKWKVPGFAGNAGGATGRAPIKEHIVSWNEAFSFSAHLVIGTDGLLQPQVLSLKIKHELSGEAETQIIGKLSLNLAEYATSSMTRRYLLEHSKINSTLRSTGDIVFRIPPLTRTHIFGGITDMLPSATKGASAVALADSPAQVTTFESSLSVAASTVNAARPLSLVDEFKGSRTSNDIVGSPLSDFSLNSLPRSLIAPPLALRDDSELSPTTVVDDIFSEARITSPGVSKYKSSTASPLSSLFAVERPLAQSHQLLRPAVAFSSPNLAQVAAGSHPGSAYLQPPHQTESVRVAGQPSRAPSKHRRAASSSGHR